MSYNYMQFNILSMVPREETILWSGKPNKRCFILEAIFNPLLPFALIWGLIDFSFINVMINSNATETYSFAIPFFALHLLPVWIYLFGVLTTGLSYKNREYIITDKNIYISDGIFTRNIKTKNYSQITEINIHRSIFDQQLGVGDVQIKDPTDITYYRRSYNNNVTEISDIRDFYKVYKLIKEIKEGKDINLISADASDVYPNNDRQIDF